MNRLAKHTKRILIGFAGWLVLLVGIILIPLPGPGWVIVFIGFSILASEFHWAKRTHAWVHDKYTVWRAWFDAQPVYIRMIFGALTLASAALVVWLINGYGILGKLLGLNQHWLISPFFK